jgi:hypothetical protein
MAKPKLKKRLVVRIATPLINQRRPHQGAQRGGASIRWDAGNQKSSRRSLSGVAMR